MLTGTIKSYNPHKGALACKESRWLGKGHGGFGVSGFLGFASGWWYSKRGNCMDLAFPAQFLFLVIFGDDRLPGLSHTRPSKTLQDWDDFLKRKWFYPKQVTFMRNFSFPPFPCYVLKKHPSTKNVSLEAVFSSISSHSSFLRPRLGVHWVQRTGYLCE